MEKIIKNFNPIEYAKRIIRNSARKTRGYNLALKKASRKEYPKNKNGNISKKYRVYYLCAHCNKWFSRKQINVDHIKPIGLSKTLEEFIVLTYCDETGYQILCKPCHKEKTKQDIKLIKSIKKKL